MSPSTIYHPRRGICAIIHSHKNYYCIRQERKKIKWEFCMHLFTVHAIRIVFVCVNLGEE